MQDDELETLLRRVIRQRPFAGDDTPGEALIQDYLTGDLTESEREHLEACLESDPELKAAIEDAQAEMEAYRERRPALRDRLAAKLQGESSQPGTTVAWSELVGSISEATIGFARRLVDNLIADVAAPAMQPAPSFRGSGTSEITAIVDAGGADSRQVKFAVVDARIESDGRCSVRLSTAERSLWSSAYRCELTLQAGDVAIVFEEETIDRRGNVGFVLNLPVDGRELTIEARYLSLRLSRDGEN